MNNPLSNFFSRGAKRTFCFCSSMILRTITCLTIVLLLTGFAVLPQAPNPPKQNYPAVIRDPADLRAKAEREWRRMLDSYGVPQTPPDLYPITNTPRWGNPSGASNTMQLNPDGSILNAQNFMAITSASGPRVIRFGLRLQF